VSPYQNIVQSSTGKTSIAKTPDEDALIDLAERARIPTNLKGIGRTKTITRNPIKTYATNWMALAILRLRNRSCLSIVLRMATETVAVKHEGEL
jgi:hypothetical protein